MYWGGIPTTGFSPPAAEEENLVDLFLLLLLGRPLPWLSVVPASMWKSFLSPCPSVRGTLSSWTMADTCPPFAATPSPSPPARGLSASGRHAEGNRCPATAAIVCFQCWLERLALFYSPLVSRRMCEGAETLIPPSPNLVWGYPSNQCDDRQNTHAGTHRLTQAPILRENALEKVRLPIALWL